MKNLILISGMLLFAAGFILTSCDSPSEKVVKAEEKVVSAKEELAEAKLNYLADEERFLLQTDEMIAANNKKIADFNSNSDHKKRELNSDYKNRIVILEKKNSALKNKLQRYSEQRKTNWEIFKVEFNRDMEQLGTELAELTNTDN